MHGASHGVTMHNARYAGALDRIYRIALVGTVQHEGKRLGLLINRN